jgi:hypothetical protein
MEETMIDVELMRAIDGMAKTITYNSDQTVRSIAATDGINTWVQTYSYAGGKLSNISLWVKQ